MLEKNEVLGKGKKNTKDGKAGRNAKSDRGGKGSKGGSKNRLYDIENISLTYSYNEVFNRNINTEFSLMRENNGGIGYNYNNSPKNYKPFSKIKFLKKSRVYVLLKISTSICFLKQYRIVPILISHIQK